MRVVVQRAKHARVIVDDTVVGSIDHGLMLLVGVTHSDTVEDVKYLSEKIVNLRIFEDDAGKMNLSLLDVKGQILSVSQFTLYGDCRKGRRPNFMEAAKPDYAEELYELFNQELRNKGIEVSTGQFGAMMDVQFTNVGPVTLILESKE
ncbi:D-tyrosyl-tRNA(Tyr) deacylase [Bacillus luteolus]|uniref:D-aminoacyl-tRNA deacylase n=1 Tax=Litchfieldia luteola TaxID=682179 RepID=A0ABR9QHY4_9BACI|nr:D-aminoacyl-tRNA deacylase [Cytobacillus luteolus]MBE4908102.1 D-tyrosyl-tRNA(Tyr) deacylase [Cytobacillus luteolus]MBP1942887.1 D-tyrosyl-tRNA(Tyr) deacylase [Cytobacillus luteolus]